LHLDVLQQMGSGSFVTATFGLGIGDHGRFDATFIECGAALSRVDLQLALRGRSAQARLAGLMLPRRGQHFDHHVQLDHRGIAGVSDQLFKGLVASGGRAVFSGQVSVAADAFDCSADQLSRGLLLGDDAEFDARPQLLISTDAVTASHGTSCGDLDGEALFFLRSRGLDEAAARRMLAQAFGAEVIDRCGVEEFRKAALEAVGQVARIRVS
jgi:Fe-S cluster assembly protein SufD